MLTMNNRAIFATIKESKRKNKHKQNRKKTKNKNKKQKETNDYSNKQAQ